MKSLKISKLFRGYEFHGFHVFLQRVSERALARLGTSIGTICRDSPDKRWNKYCQRSQPGAARELPATAANFWLMGGAAPTPRLPRLRPRCPCYCSKFLANRSSRVARAWQPASQAGRPGSRQGSLGKSPGETRGQPSGRHDTYNFHPKAEATTLTNSISGQPGVCEIAPRGRNLGAEVKVTAISTLP